MSESVDRDFIHNNRELVAMMVSNWLGFLSNEFELATAMNQEMKTFIIDKGIIYASVVASGEADVLSFDECFSSVEINEVPSFVIPSEVRKNLENEIDEVISQDLENEKEELFIINPDEHLGRKEFLYKYVVYQIKLMHKQYMAEQKVELPIGLRHLAFEDIVRFSYNDIINRAIQFSLCHEANNKDQEMCRKILVESALNSKQFHYRLEKHGGIELKKEIDNFLKTFESKKFDFDVFNIDKTIKVLLRIINKSKKIDKDLKATLITTVEKSEEIDDVAKEPFLKTIKKEIYEVTGAKESLVKKIKALSRDEFQSSLLNTIEEVEKAIDIIFDFDKYKDSQKCREIRREYRNLLENAKERVTNPAKLKNFKVVLRKAKLNYVSKYEDQYIYPFVYDLIVMSFSFSIKSELYKPQIEKINIMQKSTNEMTYKYIDTDSDENYLFKDLQQLIEVLPDEFKNVDPALLIIKHYSEILEVDYEAIANVLKQLKVKKADDGKRIYALPMKLKDIRLSIDDDHFRGLSLNII